MTAASRMLSRRQFALLAASAAAAALLPGCAAGSRQAASASAASTPSSSTSASSGAPAGTSSSVPGQTAGSFALEGARNGKSPTVTLNSGWEMPVAGIGTWSLTGATCEESVAAALASGVRLVDTAYMYGNEVEVGNAVRASGVPRGNVFVTTKIYPDQFADPERAIEQALQRLDLGYVDLMLLHHPGASDVAAYAAMERAVTDGRVRSIGLSNWYVEELEGFLPQVATTPALVQNEIHTRYQEQAVVPFIQDAGIVAQAWFPLGGRGWAEGMMRDPVLVSAAEAHGVSPAQVMLRWNLQRGVSVIPGSSNPDHIAENISVFEFELSDDEMRAIAALDADDKHSWY